MIPSGMRKVASMIPKLLRKMLRQRENCQKYLKSVRRKLGSAKVQNSNPVRYNETELGKNNPVVKVNISAEGLRALHGSKLPGSVDIKAEQEQIRYISEHQPKNIEDELIRSTDIKRIEELLSSKSKTDFKRDFIRERNLKQKLAAHLFDMNMLWCKEPQSPFENIRNESGVVKNKL